MSKMRFSPNVLKAMSNKFDLEIILLLDLSGNGATDLGSLPECINLLQLDLSANHIQYLAGIESLKSLKILNLSYNSISNIEPLKENTSLEWLALQGNQISDVDALTPIRDIKPLKRLSLQEISKEGQNPVCKKEGYRENVLSLCFYISYLDGVRRTTQLVEGEKAIAGNGKDGQYNSKEVWLSKDPKMILNSYSGHKASFEKKTNDIMNMISGLKKGLI